MPHETYEGASQERSWDANVKRTYDEYQDISLPELQRQRLQPPGRLPALLALPLCGRYHEP